MFNKAMLASLVALTLLALSLICLYNRLVPTYYFAAALGGWMLFSLYRVFTLLAKASVAPPTDNSRRYDLAFWLGAVGSSALAPLLWMLVVSQIKVF